MLEYDGFRIHVIGGAAFGLIRQRRVNLISWGSRNGGDFGWRRQCRGRRDGPSRRSKSLTVLDRHFEEGRFELRNRVAAHLVGADLEGSELLQHLVEGQHHLALVVRLYVTLEKIRRLLENRVEGHRRATVRHTTLEL